MSGVRLGKSVAPASASAPSSPVEGQEWYDLTNHLWKFYNGTEWVSAGGSGSLTENSVENKHLAKGIKNWGFVEALPGSPTKGDTCVFHTAAMGTVSWYFVYDGEKWVKIGGEPLVEEKAAGITSGTATSYTSLACEVKTPLKGDYLITIAGSIATSAAGVVGTLSYSVGATAAADADAVLNQAGWVASVCRPNRKKTAIAAATALLLRYKVSSGNGNFNELSIAIDPIRVG